MLGLVGAVVNGATTVVGLLVKLVTGLGRLLTGLVRSITR